MNNLPATLDIGSADRIGRDASRLFRENNNTPKSRPSAARAVRVKTLPPEDATASTVGEPISSRPSQPRL
jgi:hypothetical protein